MTDAAGLDLSALSAFVAVGDKSGFRAAADALGMSSAGVSKAVARLERQLGVSLVARTTRSVRLTPAGAAFHARCKAILAELGQAAEDAGEAAFEPRGRLTISMPVSYGRMRILPVVSDFVNRYRKVELEARLSDRYADLVEDGVDLAVRIGHLRDSSLKAMCLAHTGLVMCASPGYLARAGIPSHPDELGELGEHAIVGYVLPGSAQRFAYRFLVDGVVQSMSLASRLTTDDGEALVEAATRSAGLIMVADYLAERHLAEGSLVRVLRDFEAPPVPISMVQLPIRNPSPAARAFAAMLRTALATPTVVRTD